MPQIFVFFEFLSVETVGSHNGALGNLMLGPLAIAPSLLTPYIFGTISAFPIRDVFVQVWAYIGGYVDTLELTIAAYGLWHKRDSLSWMLAIWCILAVTRTFGSQPLGAVFGTIPGVSDIMFCRYAPPTWEFATITLIAFGVDAIAKKTLPQSGPNWAASAVALIRTVFLVTLAAKLLPREALDGLVPWTVLSVLWAIFSSGLAIAVLLLAHGRWRTGIFTCLLVLDSTLIFAIPTLSNPRDGNTDLSAVEYLTENLGFERFDTLGPIAPNLGAYFNISSINDDYTPLPKLWGDWVTANLDPGTDPLVFTGFTHPDPNLPSPAQELNRHLAAYEEVGVKYILVPSGSKPFAHARAQKFEPQKVYSDNLMDIYQLPSPKPYLEAVNHACVLQQQSRTSLTTACSDPTVLIRRELFFPGWQARINGQATPIAEYENLFESINLPAGKSTITYSYAPPHII